MGVIALVLSLPALAVAGESTAPARSADLAITIAGNAGVVQAGETLTFPAVVANTGPRGARRVQARITLTAPAVIATAAGDGWTCTASGASADCARRGIRRNREATITVTAIAPAGVTRVDAEATVSASRSTDPDPTDNTAQTTVAVNNAPTATSDTAATTTGMPVDVTVTGNDVDPDGDVLEASLGTPPTRGTAACRMTTCRYTPSAGATGTDTFTYVVGDGRGGRAAATVTVAVTAPPSPPAPTPPTPLPPPPPPDAVPNSDPDATVTGPTAVAGGETQRYVISITNSCAVVARDVVVQIALPEGTRLVSAPVGATRTNRTLTIRLGTVARGRTQRLALRLRFTARGGDVRTLVATVTSSNAAVTGDGIVIAVGPRR
jgi:uncharacterized repeat protein (TIGR01451 family)